MALTPEEVLAQLRTRGFEEGFQRTPLREFRGKLTSITGNMVERWTPARLEVLYNFDEVEVIESTEPYPFPVAQLSMLHSNRKKSGMGYFGASVDTIINAGVPGDAPADQVRGQDYLVGKILHMKLTGGHLIWDQGAGEERPRDCWELMSIIGADEAAPTSATSGATTAAATSATQKALELLEGKTEQQWHQVVFQDPTCKADGDLTNSIINRVFLPPLEATGMIGKDADGIYRVKKD